MPESKNKNSGFGTRLYELIFPTQIVLEDDVKNMLQKLYPNLNLEKIYFYDGMPWFMMHGFAIGITLPGTYNLQGVNIYLNDYNPQAEKCMTTIVHEMFHVQQYYDLNKGYGIGFLRPFMVFYLADYFRMFIKCLRTPGWKSAANTAYEIHPMEMPAYRQEYEFQYQYKLLGRSNILKTPPKSCVRQTSGYKYEGSWFFVGLSFIVTFGLMILKPVIEVILLIIVPFVKVIDWFLPKKRTA